MIGGWEMVETSPTWSRRMTWDDTSSVNLPADLTELYRESYIELGGHRRLGSDAVPALDARL